MSTNSTPKLACFSASVLMNSPSLPLLERNYPCSYLEQIPPLMHLIPPLLAIPRALSRKCSLIFLCHPCFCLYWIIPLVYKHATFSPIIKMKPFNLTSLSKYCPISLLLFFNKTPQYFVYMLVSIFSPPVLCFCPHSSTKTPLIKVTTDFTLLNQ